MDRDDARAFNELVEKHNKLAAHAAGLYAILLAVCEKAPPDPKRVEEISAAIGIGGFVPRVDKNAVSSFVKSFLRDLSRMPNEGPKPPAG